MRDQDSPRRPPLSDLPPPDTSDDVSESAALMRLEGPARGRDTPTLQDIDLDPDDYQEHQEPTFAQRMFSIGWMGWVRLAALCIIVGAVIQTAGVNPFDRSFTVSGALRDTVEAIGILGGWVIANGWLPLLTGAIVVVPLWLLWRLLSLPFRHRHNHARRHEP